MEDTTNKTTQTQEATENTASKPFRITVEVLDERYIKDGGAKPVTTYECGGYLLFTEGQNEPETGDMNASNTVAQGELDAVHIGNGLFQLDHNFGGRIVKHFHMRELAENLNIDDLFAKLFLAADIKSKGEGDE